MIASILVGIDQGPNLDSVLDYSAKLSQAVKCELHGLHVIDLRKIYSPTMRDLYYAPDSYTMPDLEKQLMERLEKIGSELKERFESKLNSQAVDTHFHLLKGDVNQRIHESSHEHDLLIIGTRGEHMDLEDIILGSTFKVLVSTVKKPVLFLPENSKEFGFEKVLLAYDGSDKAAQTLNFVADFVKTYNLQLSVIMCTQSQGRKFEEVNDELRNYLSRHQIEFESVLYHGKDTTKAILEESEKGYDLLCFGGYDSGLMETLLFGSVSQKLLHDAKIPCLMVR